MRGRLIVFGVLMGLVMGSAANAATLTIEATSTSALGRPHDLVTSTDGRLLFVADLDNDRVLRLRIGK